MKQEQKKKIYTADSIQKMEDEVNARNGWKPIRTIKRQGFIIILKQPKEIEKKEKEGEY